MVSVPVRAAPGQPHRRGRTGVLGGRGHRRRPALLRGSSTSAPDEEAGDHRPPRHRPAAAGDRRGLHFRPAVAVGSCYAGPVDDSERAVRTLREFDAPLVDLVGPTLYVDHQSGIDDTVPGWHYYWYRPHRPARRGDRRRRRARLPCRLREVMRGDVPSGGAVRRAIRDATAYPGRDVDHNIIVGAVWLPEEDDTVRAPEDRVGPGLPRRPGALAVST